MSKEDVSKIIKEIVGNDDFEIVEFEDADGGMRIIVKFKDIEKATNFVNSVEIYEREGGNKNYIKRAMFTIRGPTSLCTLKIPSLLILLLSFV